MGSVNSPICAFIEGGQGAQLRRLPPTSINHFLIGHRVDQRSVLQLYFIKFGKVELSAMHLLIGF